MNTSANQKSVWRSYLSPFKIALLAVNGVCFGACVVLLVSGADNVALVFLTIGTGLGLLSGLVGAIIASRKNVSLDDARV